MARALRIEFPGAAGFTLGGAAQTLTFDAASRIIGETYFPSPAQSLTYSRE